MLNGNGIDASEALKHDAFTAGGKSTVGDNLCAVRYSAGVQPKAFSVVRHLIRRQVIRSQLLVCQSTGVQHSAS
jgi:hypothetical protein